jgi:hypothetical protein
MFLMTANLPPALVNTKYPTGAIPKSKVVGTAKENVGSPTFDYLSMCSAT